MGLWHEHSPFQTAINAEKRAAGDQSNRGCPIEGDGRRSESGPSFALRVCIEMSQPKISTGEELLPQGPSPSSLSLFSSPLLRSSSSAHSLFAPSHVRILYTGRRRGGGGVTGGRLPPLARRDRQTSGGNTPPPPRRRLYHGFFSSAGFASGYEKGGGEERKRNQRSRSRLGKEREEEGGLTTHGCDNKQEDEGRR